MDISYLYAGQLISMLCFSEMQILTADEVAITILDSLYFFGPNMMVLFDPNHEKLFLPKQNTKKT